MSYAANGLRNDAGVRANVPNQNRPQSDIRHGSNATRRAVSKVTEARRKRVAPQIRQRDLTKFMKATKAAGMATFELVDIESGFIIRAFASSERPVTSDDLDIELERFKERVGG
jgi:hypothetical protein